MATRESRARALEAIQAERFDLLVIGAGIIGARVALEAAASGRRVALVDAGDFGGGTSSASSKLIHGGLRYLQMGDLGLVRESHRERRALLERVAPNLVRPLQFVVPVYRGGPFPRALVAAGLLTYSALSGFRHSRARMVGPAAARELIPSLRLDHLLGCGVYLDAQTNDGRLVLATVSGAVRAGAVVLNHAAVTGLEFGANGVTAGLAGGGEVRSHQVVNAAGPWVDRIRLLEEAETPPMARLSKGVHLLLPAEPGWEAALTVPLPDGRVAFAVPWEGMLMLGTTDTPYDGDPRDVTVTDADEAMIFEEAAQGLPAEMLRSERVVYRFAGLRVLPGGTGKTSDATREHLVRRGRLGMVSVAGGKLTTHRRIALDVLQRVDGLRGLKQCEDPLPGSDPLPARPPEVDAQTWEHLTHLHGSEAGRVLVYRSSVADAMERIHPDGPDIWAQVHHAADEEWAVTVSDVVRRRTSLEIQGHATPAIRARIAAILEG